MAVDAFVDALVDAFIEAFVDAFRHASHATADDPFVLPSDAGATIVSAKGQLAENPGENASGKSGDRLGGEKPEMSSEEGEAKE